MPLNFLDRLKFVILDYRDPTEGSLSTRVVLDSDYREIFNSFRRDPRSFLAQLGSAAFRRSIGAPDEIQEDGVAMPSLPAHVTFHPLLWGLLELLPGQDLVALASVSAGIHSSLAYHDFCDGNGPGSIWSHIWQRRWGDARSFPQCDASVACDVAEETAVKVSSHISFVALRKALSAELRLLNWECTLKRTQAGRGLTGMRTLHQAGERHPQASDLKLLDVNQCGMVVAMSASGECRAHCLGSGAGLSALGVRRRIAVAARSSRFLVAGIENSGKFVMRTFILAMSTDLDLGRWLLLLLLLLLQGRCLLWAWMTGQSRGL